MEDSNTKLNYLQETFEIGKQVGPGNQSVLQSLVLRVHASPFFLHNEDGCYCLPSINISPRRVYRSKQWMDSRGGHGSVKL
jgi:hypothetical protein